MNMDEYPQDALRQSADSYAKVLEALDEFTNDPNSAQMKESLGAVPLAAVIWKEMCDQNQLHPMADIVAPGVKGTLEKLHWFIAVMMVESVK